MHLLPARQSILQGLGALLAWACLCVTGCLAAVATASAQGVELVTLATDRRDGALTLEFAARVTLPKTVEDALRHGVPIYFVAQADLKRDRWYWRDERVARVTRQWRLAYQPLTGTWRVGLAGINQTHNTLEEALAVMSRSAGWRLAELAQVDPDSRHYVDFSYKLDTSQLPGPMQFGLGGGGEWAVGVERSVRVE
jgi:Domain of unknown function (DUF4390)